MAAREGGHRGRTAPGCAPWVSRTPVYCVWVPARVCWNCKVYSNMSALGGSGAKVRDGADWLVMATYRCDHCLLLNLALARTTAVDPQQPAEWHLSTVVADQLQWLPSAPLGKDYPDVPDAIASAASEVHGCLSIGAGRAAVGLARAVVEATAKERGITTGRLIEKIDTLKAQGLIREDTREAAHEVRLDGNGVAHGDLAEAGMSIDDAQVVVALMDEVLNEVYQSPARVRRVRDQRARRRDAATSP